MTGWRLIRGSSLVTARWRNGLGTSREIAGETGAEGVPLWQVSIADLEQDAPFSHYPHCDRVFTPIAGEVPPELAFHGGPFEPCPLLVPRRFPGDVPTLSRVPAPGRAFNAIVDRRVFGVEVVPVLLAAGTPFQVPAGVHMVVHCVSGGVVLGNWVLAAGDSVLGGGGGAVGAAVGAAVVLVVRVT